MDTIKRFIDCNVPTQICNLHCPYCYVGQVDGFSGKIEPIKYSPDMVRAALSKKRMGGLILINFCGTGETLIGEDILPIVHEVLKEGHYAQIVTNGTISKRFDEIASWDKKLLDRLLVKFSYHYEEFKKLNILDAFFDNVKKVKRAGCSISVEVTSGDNLVQYKDELKAKCISELGAMPHVTVVRDSSKPDYPLLSQYKNDEYISIWGGFDSKLFDLKMHLLSQKREEFCYGGEWTFYLYLSNGDLKQCYRGEVIDNIFEDINRPIRFKPVGHKCCEPYCFNGHAWMTLGCIPNIVTPSYADMRNRVLPGGEEWLTDSVKEFFSHKLCENNIIYDNTTDAPKILILGDSISQGYREYIRDSFLDAIDVYYPDGIVTFSAYMLRYLHEIAEKLSIGSNIDLVYFNVGLWDVLRIYGDEPLTDKELYVKNLGRIVDRLKFLFPNAQLVFALTTPVKEELVEYKFIRLNEDIDQYNAAAKELLKEKDVYIHDLNSFAVKELSDYYVDFTHFSDEAYHKLSDHIVSYITQLVKTNSARKMDFSLDSIDKSIRCNDETLKISRIVIYGAGVFGLKTIKALKEMRIDPFVVLDKDENKQNTCIDGIKIVSPYDYINNLCDVEKDLLIIAINNTQLRQDIRRKLLQSKKIRICSYKVIKSLEKE